MADTIHEVIQSVLFLVVAIPLLVITLRRRKGVTVHLDGAEPRHFKDATEWRKFVLQEMLIMHRRLLRTSEKVAPLLDRGKDGSKGEQSFRDAVKRRDGQPNRNKGHRPRKDKKQDGRNHS